MSYTDWFNEKYDKRKMQWQYDMAYYSWYPTASNTHHVNLSRQGGANKCSLKHGLLA